MSSAIRKRLAIIGCGSSGLISLKQAVDELPDWEIVCFERSTSLIGRWGKPYPGFVSTSTKYTTQFSSFPLFDGTCLDDHGRSRAEFFREGEYGEYLTRFADEFGLRKFVRFRHEVEQIMRSPDGLGWRLVVRNIELQQAALEELHFDAVIIGTGLAAVPRRMESTVPIVELSELSKSDDEMPVKNQNVVVIGGGESAVDYAVRLSRPKLGNRVFLSLRTGIRVSPRYHPIGGVPSDFLRNRLMLSIHEDIRNWIGERFVRFRILYQERMEGWFPKSSTAPAESQADSSTEEQRALRKKCTHLLTVKAKDELFNTFHNKSDDFLNCVARGELTIVGQATDPSFRTCRSFESDEPVEVNATAVFPSIGYRSTLGDLSNGRLSIGDFYMGCCHVEYPDIFLVGFARPILGNIPTMSEMQARLATKLLGRKVDRPSDLRTRHAHDRRTNLVRFPKLYLETIYPVEMIPYMDRLAGWMGVFPTRRRLGSWREWWRTQLAPASTLHYWSNSETARKQYERTPIYMPSILVVLLLCIKPFDWLYRGYRLLMKPFQGLAHE